jgi:hypothetical protein
MSDGKSENNAQGVEILFGEREIRVVAQVSMLLVKIRG